METHQNTASRQAQQVIAGISAQLSQLAKNPPDLAAYLRAHANLLNEALHPQGLSYKILSGSTFKRLFSVNLKQLNLKDNPPQDESFRKAVEKVAVGKNPIVFAAHAHSQKTHQSLNNETAVTSDHLALFNDTPFEQFFIPIPVDSKVAGVLQVWFKPVNQETTKSRLMLLKHFCEEIVLYFRSRQATDLTQEITRLNTYSHLLEDLAGDIDLDSVAWNIVNYARETVACERVSIFNVKDILNQNGHGLDFEILACSGLKRPHVRSEQAEILKELVRELAKFTLNNTREGSLNQKTLPPSITPQVEADKSFKPLIERNESSETIINDQKSALTKDAVVEEKPTHSLPTGDRPRFNLTFTYRDKEKTATRPEAINQYFELLPMNWATSLPLFDRAGQVCGILLFEGQKDADKAKGTFLNMRDLAYSGGRSLGTSLYWNKQRSYKLIQSIAQLKSRYINTNKRSLMLKVWLPIVIALLILCMPVRFKIGGEAMLRPTNFQSLSSMVSARLDKVLVREGQSVHKGDLLAVIETRDLALQLHQAQQEYQRYLAESDLARNIGDETLMQIAQLSASKQAALADKYKFQISQAEVRAPFDGVIIGPLNLQMRVGDVLNKGDTIVEMAQPDSWEVKIDIREQDLVFLEKSLLNEKAIRSELKFNADPTKTHTLILSDLAQLSYGLETRFGNYAFAAILPINESMDTGQLKIGYTGNAEFLMGRRPLAYIMFRDVVHFFRVR